MREESPIRRRKEYQVKEYLLPCIVSTLKHLIYLKLYQYQLIRHLNLILFCTPILNTNPVSGSRKQMRESAAFTIWHLWFIHILNLCSGYLIR
jgi:hypothetical protein